jgi:hypothetical protein
MPRTHRISTPAGARPLRALALVSVTLLAGGLLTACGGSGSPSATNAAASEQAQEVKFQDFAKCLREHGINAETAAMPGGGHGLKISPGSAHGPAAFEAAQNACARYRPEQKNVNLSPQQKVELEEHVQKFAKCMREHGIRVETSTAGGGVHMTMHHSGEGAANPESPGFQRAQSACQQLLPKPPGGGKGPLLGGAATRSSAKGGEGAQLSSSAGK